MTDITTVVHNHIAMWNETTPEDRRGGVDFATVADDGRLRAVTRFLEPI